MHRIIRPDLTRLLDGPQYKKRNVIEQLFSRLRKHVGSVSATITGHCVKAVIISACLQGGLRNEFQTVFSINITVDFQYMSKRMKLVLAPEKIGSAALGLL